jgi:MFS family permease
VLLAQLIQAFAGGAFFAGIGPHLQRNLGGDAAAYGIQGTAYGVALMLGAWAIGRRGVRRIGVLYAAGFVVNGLGNSGFALAPSLAALLPAAFLAGLGAAAFITGEITLLQTVVPAAVRGRVIALTILLATATGMVGLACGGWLADYWHLRPLMLLASVVHIAVGLALWAHPALRHARTSHS